MFDIKQLRQNFKASETRVEDCNDFFIAGCDEVGRGPLAGPVVAACVSLHLKKYEEKEIKSILKKWKDIGVYDSKKISSEKRHDIVASLPFSRLPFDTDQLYTHQYSENLSLSIVIKEISPQIIDEINILNASLKAMKEAALFCCDFKKSGLLMIDGNRTFKTLDPTVVLRPVVKGDALSLLIGMASIVAKVYRDNLMAEYCLQYPGYNWKNNAGYATKQHLEGIALLGLTEIHRKSFSGVKEVYAGEGD